MNKDLTPPPLKTESAEDCFRARGFKPPAQYLVKRDPRGSEYGEFRAKVLEHTLEVEVSKWMPGRGEAKAFYVMVFRSVADFNEWALDQT